METPAPRPAGSPVPLGLAVAVTAVVAWVLALVRSWGDTGVDPQGDLTDGHPVGVLALLGLGALVASVLALAATGRAGRGRPLPFRLTAGGLVVVLGAVSTGAVVTVLRAQVLPRDGGWWALLAGIAQLVAGVAVVAVPARPVGRGAGLAARALTVVVPVAIVAAGVTVAPGWSDHRVDASYPASFDESPGRTTLTRVAWRQDFGADSTVAVLGGRAVVATDRRVGGSCRLDVRALDAGTGRPVWSVDRPLRCDGPRLAAVDGDNQVVRVTLRGEPVGGGPLTGAAHTLYLELESGRPLTPSSALDDVAAWTEGFGLVLTAAEVRGLAPRTGVVAWSRPLPRCPDGGAARVAVPTAPPAGRLGSRSPYDDALPNGAVPVVGEGNDIVLGTTCSVDGDTTRSVWLLDAVHGPGSDRTVTLPTAADPGAAAGRAGPAADVPTTFLPWLDTVVAVIPVAAPAGSNVRAALVGIDLATGRIGWQRPAPSSPLTAVDLSPTDGSVRSSSSASPAGSSGGTVVLDVHTGAVLADRADPEPVVATVGLTGGRVEFGSTGDVVVRDPVSGAVVDSVAIPNCTVATGGHAAPALAGPGGVVVRCDPAVRGGTTVVGLTS